jgi:hypothetical protein
VLTADFFGVTRRRFDGGLQRGKFALEDYVEILRAKDALRMTRGCVCRAMLGAAEDYVRDFRWRTQAYGGANRA